MLVDGSWQKRQGHNSLNGLVSGVVSAIEVKSGQIVDYNVTTIKCKECHHWSKKDKKSVEYEAWKMSV